jgi:ribosomal protein S27E
MDTPFEIGQNYWAPRHHAELVTLPCPACKGTRIVAIVYGDEHVSVDCEACGKGFEGPQGTITEYDFTPKAERFVIASVDSLYNGRWSVRSETGQTSNFDELCETEEAALAISAVKCAEQHESNMRSRMHGRSRAANATWSVSYHKKCIVDLERQLAWHTARINAGKVKKEKA